MPTGAGAEETRQLIEGHIISINREPGLAQVIVQERRRVMLGLKLYLVDQSGVFAEAHTEDFQDTAQSATVTSELENYVNSLRKLTVSLNDYSINSMKLSKLKRENWRRRDDIASNSGDICVIAWVSSTPPLPRRTH